MAKQKEPKPNVPRDLCDAVDVVTFARVGALQPGIRHGLLGTRPIPMAFLAQITGDRGTVELIASAESPPRTLSIERILTHAGPRWQWLCDRCGGRARKLYRPRGDVTAPDGQVHREADRAWLCRTCWSVGYRRALPMPLSAEARQRRVRAVIREIHRLERAAAAEPIAPGHSSPGPSSREQ
jgi:hypothetical protein